jgi:hypothetical protein
LLLRALDWVYDAPIIKHPVITIYHSSERGSNVFANIGFAGFIGSITAINDQGMAFAEKVWKPVNLPQYKATYVGKPWIYMFRDLA